MIPCRMNPMGITLSVPLTFTALAANSSVKLTATGSPVVSGMKYRTRSGSWTAYTVNTEIPLANVGDYVQFWNTGSQLSTSTSNFAKFVMSGSISASGNLQSMLNFAKATYNYCYYGLFGNCTSLIHPPKLPGKVSTNCYFDLFYGCSGMLDAPDLMDQTIGGQSYCRMFHGCSSLLTPPRMPETVTLANSLRHCYQMFYGCSSLTATPQFSVSAANQECFRSMFEGCSSLTDVRMGLQATTLAATCYRGMFYNCTALVDAPDLPADTLANESYMWMFGNCTALKSCEVNFTSWTGATDATTNWMANVPSGGTFTKPGALAADTGASRIPSGWTVVNK